MGAYLLQCFQAQLLSKPQVSVIQQRVRAGDAGVEEPHDFMRGACRSVSSVKASRLMTASLAPCMHATCPVTSRTPEAARVAVVNMRA